MLPLAVSVSPLLSPLLPLSGQRRRRPFLRPGGASRTACAIASLAATAALLLPSAVRLSPACAATASTAPGRRDGVILRLFDRQTVYIVTNDDPALADSLLDGCAIKSRRVLTLDEWRKEPHGVDWYVSPVFLINRERLAPGETVPDSCDAAVDEIWTEVRRMGHSGGVTYQITLSAPDGTWLRRAVAEFRRRSDIPRGPQRRSVHSVAVVPFGTGAQAAAEAVLKQENGDTRDDFSRNWAAHELTPAEWRGLQGSPRFAAMDEVLLVDRGSIGAAPAPADEAPPAPPTGASATAVGGAADTIAWRERKQDGHLRAIYSAPSGAALADAASAPGDPLAGPEAPTVVATARDLRAVRRVVVAGVRGGVGGPEMAKRLASVAATDLRALNAFEVLERAGMNEVLSEIALGEAGITHSADRAKVRRLAAADALLIVEVTDATGRTSYSEKCERLTPPLGPPPRRPAEPTRLRYDIVFPGAENNPVVRGITESVLSHAVGTKTDREYRHALNEYNDVVLPRWQSEVDDYDRQRQNRSISWKQVINATHEATIKGSMRLVDLTDGLVLWEAPFSATEQQAEPYTTRQAITTGDDSPEPGLPDDCSAESAEMPDPLFDRAAESAMQQGIAALRASALLPADAPLSAAAQDAPAASVKGRLLDVDGDSLLIGLGAGDGVKPGDVLSVTLENGQSARVVTTRVRPRTCDAAFDPAVPPSLRARVAVGQEVTR